MVNAGVLNVLVTASTGKANAALRTTQAQFRSTAATASKSATATSSSWKRAAVGVAAGGAIIGGVSGKLAVDFDKAMRNVNSIAQLPEPAFQRLSASVRDLAGPTAQAPKTLAEGMYDLVSSGFDAAESLTIMKSSAQGATAGLTDAATSTKVVAAVLNAYRQPAEKAQAVTDTLFRTVDRGVITFEDLAQNIGDTLPFASTLGVELYELGAATATLTKQGLGPPETMTRIRNVLQTLIKPGEDLQKVFKELGMSGEEMIEKFGFQGTLDRLVAATDGTKEAVAALFPNIRALGGVLALTGENSQEAAKNLRLLETSSGSTSKALSQQSKSVAFQWQQLKAESSALAIEWGTALVPIMIAVVKVLGDITGVVGGAVEGFTNLPTPVLAAVAAMAGFLAIAKIVTFILGSALVAGIGSAITTLGILALEFTSVAAASGVLAGAWSAVSLAFATNPIGAAVVGVGLLTGGVLALTGALDGLFSSEKEIPKLQQEYKETTERLTNAMEREQNIVGLLTDSSKKTRRAKQKEKEASEEVTEAQRALNKAQEKFPPLSEPVLQAHTDLAQAKRKEAKATDRLEEAERQEGFIRKSSKMILRDAFGAAKEHIRVLRRQRGNIMDTWKAQVKYGASTEDLTESEQRATKKAKQLREARGTLGQVIQDAATKIGPKFVKSLRDMTAFEEELGRKVKITARVFKNPYENSLFDALDTTDELGKGVEKLGGNYKNTQKTANKATSKIATQTGNLLGDLGVKGSSLSLKKKTGGFFVGGHGYGDKVPVSLLLEPGETGFILNRHATQEAAALTALNNQFPRNQMRAGGWVDPAGPGTGVVNPAIAKAVGQWSQRYDAAINYGFDPGGGHVSPGHNVTGTATDTGPAAGWTPTATALFERGLRALIGKVPQILYGTAGIGTSYPGHGRGDHAHIEWGMNPAGFITDMIKRVIIAGPDSTFKDIAQQASDNVWKAANRYLRAKAGVFGSEGSEMGKGSGAAYWSNLWNNMGGAPGLARIMGAIVMAESSGNADAFNGIARGPYQFTAPTWADFGSGPWTRAHDPEAATKAAINVIRREGHGGLNRWDVYRSGAYQQFMKEGGGVARAQHTRNKLSRVMRKIGKFDEKIQIAETLSGLERSPFGSDLSPSEIAQQVKLQRGLMKQLKKANRLARHGSKSTSRTLERLADSDDIKKIQKRIETEKDLLAAEKDRKKPRRKEIERHTKALDKLERELSKAREDQGGVRDKLRNMLSTFRDTKTEMEGVTGRGGRIFDTMVAIKELLSTETGTIGSSGLTMDQLLSIAEVSRLGTFDRQLGIPSYGRGGYHHSGGWALVGEHGPELARMPAGTRVHNNQESQGMMASTLVLPHMEIKVGNETVAEIVDETIDLRDKKVQLKARKKRRGR